MMKESIWEINSGIDSRCITAENPTGEKGKGAMSEPWPGHVGEHLGKGWKISPCVGIRSGEVYTVADINGPGIIRHIWMTCGFEKSPNLMGWYGERTRHRDLIIRFFWEDQSIPSIECPVGDFFCSGLGSFAQVTSAMVCVNPQFGFNCYWEMPFLKRCRIELENRGPVGVTLYYAVDYQLRELPENVGYFHAQFRRSNPTGYMVPHVILDGVRGQGQYVGTYICWGVHSCGWWGEGEVKFYIDDDEYPTICGTGTEDYFGGAYNFENTSTRRYQEFSTPYTGMPQVIRPDGLYQSQTRFGMYRWHIADPVYFKKNLKVDIQALGWETDLRYRPLRDDISSVAFWYQTLPASPFPPLPSADEIALN